METQNCCHGCIGKDGNDCCVDVFLILNPDEIHIFENHEGFNKVKNGGIFYTIQGCPYFKSNNCRIHDTNKPMYCKFYPIFITGNPFIHIECLIHNKYELSDEITKKIHEIQTKYPIYKREWFWEEVKDELKINDE